MNAAIKKALQKDEIKEILEKHGASESFFVFPKRQYHVEYGGVMVFGFRESGIFRYCFQ